MIRWNIKLGHDRNLVLLDGVPLPKVNGVSLENTAAAIMANLRNSERWDRINVHTLFVRYMDRAIDEGCTPQELKLLLKQYPYFTLEVFDEEVPQRFLNRFSLNLEVEGSSLRNLPELKQTCASCKFCFSQDHGYSNYTVEETTSECLHNDPQFPLDNNGLKEEYVLSVYSCDKYKGGVGIGHLDVDGEDPPNLYDDELRQLWEAR